ncbi:MAG: hypothetical protein EA425_11115 [Puniceicoccaceae bacterium]|nr:MAG: hypothetical protein EA425_11115 [Puniceicoccaceae bacterium]
MAMPAGGFRVFLVTFWHTCPAIPGAVAHLCPSSGSTETHHHRATDPGASDKWTPQLDSVQPRDHADPAAPRRSRQPAPIRAQAADPAKSHSAWRPGITRAGLRPAPWHCMITAVETSMEILLPGRLPVMTLRDTVFFPHAFLPLFIFEPRYRTMLQEVLKRERIFVVVNEDPEGSDDELPCPVGTAGIIRLSHQNPDGTAHLFLQGLIRVKILGIAREEPYRLVDVQPLYATEDRPPEDLLKGRRRLITCLNQLDRLGEPLEPAIAETLKKIRNPSVFCDLAAFAVCSNPSLKQRLLETLETGRRTELLLSWLRGQLADLKLRRKLQGSLPDDEVDSN